MKSTSSGSTTPPATIDLFWPGVLMVEQKSVGRDLAAARDQAGTYFDALQERDRPRFQLLCDFQTFELLDRDEREETREALACPRDRGNLTA